MTVDQEAATRKQRQCVRERTQEPAEKESRKGHGDSRSDEKSGIDGAGVMTYRVCHLPPRLLLYVYEGCVAACVILELLGRTFATDWKHARSLSLQSSEGPDRSPTTNFACWVHTLVYCVPDFGYSVNYSSF